MNYNKKDQSLENVKYVKENSFRNNFQITDANKDNLKSNCSYDFQNKKQHQTNKEENQSKMQK